MTNSAACVAGNHDTCGGHGWDDVTNKGCRCLCDCHVNEILAELYIENRDAYSLPGSPRLRSKEEARKIVRICMILDAPITDVFTTNMLDKIVERVFVQ